MRQAIRDKLTSVLDNSRESNVNPPSANSDDQRPIADRLVNFVKEKGSTLVSTVHEHVSSVTDTTGALAKQKILQTLFSSGVVRSEDIRQALQIGIAYFLDQKWKNQSESCEYIQREKFPAGGNMAPPHSLQDFDFEAYGLDTFIALMHMFGTEQQTFRNDICQGELKEIVNPSSSGSLLYLTSNSKYLIKTARGYDAKFIQQKFLQAYYYHITQMPGTFIAKFFGVYGYIPYLSQQRGITVDSFTLRFVIFSNIIPNNIDIHEKYDLKGSSYKRDASFNERIKSSATFKDNDFRDLHPQGLILPKHIYYHLKQVMTSDVDFLEKLNIMDYSLLLTIHNMDNPVKPQRKGSLEALMGCLPDTLLLGMEQQRLENKSISTNEPKLLVRMKPPTNSLGFIYEEIPKFDIEAANAYGGIPAINEKGEHLILFLGIIDILQTFDICKVMQRQYQTVENPDVVAERSIVQADFYAQRFKEFMFEHVFRPDDDSNLINPAALPPSTSVYPPSSYEHTYPSASYEQNSFNTSSLYPQVPYYNS